MAWALRYPLRISLLGDLSNVCSILVFCEERGCGHRAQLDLMALLEKYGPEMEIDAVKRKVYCPKCREAGRPDRNLSWQHAHLNGDTNHSRFLGEIYNEKHGIT